MVVINHIPTRPEADGDYRVRIFDAVGNACYVFHCDREYLQNTADEFARWAAADPGTEPAGALAQTLRILQGAIESLTPEPAARHNAAGSLP